MKHSRSFYHHGVQLVLHALLRYVLQRPIPIVIVIRAEHRCARHNLAPGAPIKCEAHVVLAAHPRSDLNLVHVRICEQVISGFCFRFLGFGLGFGFGFGLSTKTEA